MATRITISQSRRVNQLIRELCCNHAEGNCLLLDDGDENPCVQLISRYGIYCKYFLSAVLPADKELEAEILSRNRPKTCANCGERFHADAKNKRYCEKCAGKVKRRKAAERKRRQREREKSSGPSPPVHRDSEHRILITKIPIHTLKGCGLFMPETMQMKGEFEWQPQAYGTSRVD